MGWTLIDRENVTSAVTQIDFTIDGTYDEIYFNFVGFKSNTDERNLGYQFIRSGATGYDREIQTSAWNQWLYAEDYSHGGDHYQGSWDSDISDAASSSTQFTRLTQGGDTHRAYSAASGELTIYRPQDTTHYKHLISVAGCMDAHIHDFQRIAYLFRTSGYVKDTAALTGIRFVSCNYAGDQDGTIAYIDISMYGLS